MPENKRTLEYWLDQYDTISSMTVSSRKTLIQFMKKHHSKVADDLPSIYRVNAKLAKQTGVNPVQYDYCVHSCIAYTGMHKTEDHCFECQEPRYYARRDRKGLLKARKQQCYFPIVSRLLRQFTYFDLAKALSTYRHEFGLTSDKIKGVNITDFFLGQLYK